jgi:hypothetical protein
MFYEFLHCFYIRFFYSDISADFLWRHDDAIDYYRNPDAYPKSYYSVYLPQLPALDPGQCWETLVHFSSLFPLTLSSHFANNPFVRAD